ncbi:ATP-binding protein [Palleronia caenipelagi]|uniref:C4-dicarboxylate transport sensor protein DctB n=1 Tax=Palleronia caenipelagi TaxID=2489174 RepID=A0A547PMC6_9RHOB|nr:ATP-binding protein [Palleronia caenipelagi]TRD15299.1 sensor histidine kinase [Palleronia caenipelagi]
MSAIDDIIRRREKRRSRIVRFAFMLLVIVAVTTLWVSYSFLTARFTEATRSRAEVRLALYSGNLISALQRASVVPLLLSRDPALISALGSGDFSQSTQRLISYLDEIGAASLTLLDRSGRVVASTNRETLGAQRGGEPFAVNAIRSPETVFSTTQTESGMFTFSYSRRVEINGVIEGVIVVGVDLRQFETSWAGFSDAVMVTDSTGRIILSTESRWRGLTEEEALQRRSATGAIQRAIQATTDWTVVPADAYLGGQAVLRQSTRIPFQGWRMTSFTTYSSVRDRVVGVLAIEATIFAMIFALGSFLVSRKALSRISLFERESEELRRLNTELQREIAERQKAERNLEVAEQTVQQTSKLAVLGEMSASVSHELNQPLAAMKTYLAGARLLVQRRRSEEALASLHRIDDLIGRMGAITRQLKSYARKGGTAVEPLDLRDCVSSALALMEPQLKQRDVLIERTVPDRPVMVLTDRLRVEQVIVNLLRNALDATKDVKDPRVRILLASGRTASLVVRDNGSGIQEMDRLFEPFYTTKDPGHGTGLGLAISSDIVHQLGGRLTGRNGSSGGAVFEMDLPLWRSAEAAE